MSKKTTVKKLSRWQSFDKDKPPTLSGWYQVICSPTEKGANSWWAETAYIVWRYYDALANAWYWNYGDWKEPVKLDFPPTRFNDKKVASIFPEDGRYKTYWRGLL